MERKYPFDEKRFEESAKRFFSAKRAPLWIAVGVGIASIVGGVAAVVGHKRKAKQQRTLSFDREIRGLEVGNGIEMSLSFGAQQRLTIEATERDMKGLMCDMKDNRLRIYLLPEMLEKRKKCSISVSLALDKLTSLIVGGEAVIYADGINQTKEFTIEQMGSHVMGLTVEAERIKALLTGAFYAGIALNGGGASFAMLGDGTADLTFNETQSTDCRMAGKCTVCLTGSAKKFVLQASGATELNASDLMLDKANIHLTEKATAEIYCHEMERSVIQDEAKLTLRGVERGRRNVSLRDDAELVFAESE